MTHLQKTVRSRFRHRNGIATLEFVLGFPFLLFIFAMILTVAKAGVNRSEIVRSARYDLWKMRDSQSQSSSGLENVKRNSDAKPMSIPIPTKFVKSMVPGGASSLSDSNQFSRDSMPGEISGTSSKSFQTYSWLGGGRTAKYDTAMIHWTWDHTEYHELEGSNPHIFSVIGSMAGLKPNGLGQQLAQGIETVLGLVL